MASFRLVAKVLLVSTSFQFLATDTDVAAAAADRRWTNGAARCKLVAKLAASLGTENMCGDFVDGDDDGYSIKEEWDNTVQSAEAV